MAYQKTVWQTGVEYGPETFNKFEEEIERQSVELEKLDGAGSVGLKSKQTINLAKAMNKLRQNQVTEFCFMGDSVFYAFDYMGEDAVPETCVPDNGVPMEGFKRSPVTIYDTFIAYMNKVYENKIRLKKKTYTGDCAWTAYYRWNPSQSDFIIINYGINDAVGGHITSSYHPELPMDYRGDVELFTVAIRKLVEREIENGTAVVLMSPTKQTLRNTGTDIDDRTIIDIYEQAMKDVASEYGCVFIDGNEVTHSFGNTMAIDAYHFTKEGFKAIGQRMASYFIGQSPMHPVTVHGGSYLGVHPNQDNANITVPTEYVNTTLSPNPPVVLNSDDLYVDIDREAGGLQANVTGSGMITWSFYAPQELVVVPSLYTKDDMSISVKLDYGSAQGVWSNYWNAVTPEGAIDRNYVEPSEIEIKYADLPNLGLGKVYAPHVLTESMPVLKIVSKGWHTVTIAPKKLNPVREVTPFSDIPEDFGSGVIQVFGLHFYTLDDYRRLVKA